MSLVETLRLPGLTLQRKDTVLELDRRKESLLKTNRLTNAGLWFAIIKDRGHLKKSEVSSIVRTYNICKSLLPGNNISLAELFERSKLKNAPSDSFYEKVCFNYDSPISESSDGNLWPVEEWVEYDLNRLGSDGAVNKDSGSDQVFHPTRKGSTFFYREYVSLHGVFSKKLVPLLKFDELIKPDRPCLYYDRVYPNVVRLFE